MRGLLEQWRGFLAQAFQPPEQVRIVPALVLSVSAQDDLGLVERAETLVQASVYRGAAG